MNLIVDIGNTRTKIAFFSQNELVEKAVLTNGSLEELSAKVQTMGAVEAAILSATGRDTEGVENYLSQHFRFIKFDHETPLPIKNEYATPQTLGKDRLASVVAAHQFFPNQNCLVIDAGTCITYNLLSASGVFLGGNIAPGLTMRLKAMHHFTAKLPEVERNTEGGQNGEKSAQNWIGRTTEEAMQIGAQMGLVVEVEGFYKRFKNQFGSIQLVLTGGDGAFLNQNISIKKKHFEPNLVFKGLNNILNFSR